MSAANAVCDHMYGWIRGTPRGQWTSMGVVSDGSYGVQKGLVFSYPVTCRNGKWKVGPGGGQAGLVPHQLDMHVHRSGRLPSCFWFPGPLLGLKLVQ